MLNTVLPTHHVLLHEKSLKARRDPTGNDDRQQKLRLPSCTYTDDHHKATNRSGCVLTLVSSNLSTPHPLLNCQK
jgi:hypothetical protein